MPEIAQTVPGLWLQLLAAAGFILLASNFLAKSADIIALRTGLGRSVIGVVLLATATSLPELSTGVGAIAIVDNPDLAAGDAFGSNLFNLLIIGLLELFWRGNGTPILEAVGTTPVFMGILGMLVISTAAVAILFHQSSPGGAFSGWSISPITVILAAIFLFSMYLIYRVSQSAEHDESTDENYESESLLRAGVTYAIAAVVIIGAAIWLARTGEGIAHAMHWEASFVGTQFLAFSTSMPELAASLAAIRIGAPELAISNVLGSNLFNMGFILSVDDIVLVGEPLWSSISSIHLATAMFAVIMTCVVLVGLMQRNRMRRPFDCITYESAALIALYIVASLYVFRFAT